MWLQRNASFQTPMGIETPVKRATPEITVTVHNEKVDSEDEESGSEDDDEYPDKVNSASCGCVNTNKR